MSVDGERRGDGVVPLDVDKHVRGNGPYRVIVHRDIRCVVAVVRNDGECLTPAHFHGHTAARIDRSPGTGGCCDDVRFGICPDGGGGGYRRSPGPMRAGEARKPVPGRQGERATGAVAWQVPPGCWRHLCKTRRARATAVMEQARFPGRAYPGRHDVPGLHPPPPGVKGLPDTHDCARREGVTAASGRRASTGDTRREPIAPAPWLTIIRIHYMWLRNRARYACRGGSPFWRSFEGSSVRHRRSGIRTCGRPPNSPAGALRSADRTSPPRAERGRAGRVFRGKDAKRHTTAR
jgi:hypothetical protein